MLHMVHSVQGPAQTAGLGVVISIHLLHHTHADTNSVCLAQTLHLSSSHSHLPSSSLGSWVAAARRLAEGWPDAVGPVRSMAMSTPASRAAAAAAAPSASVSTTGSTAGEGSAADALAVGGAVVLRLLGPAVCAARAVINMPSGCAVR